MSIVEVNSFRLEKKLKKTLIALIRRNNSDNTDTEDPEFLVVVDDRLLSILLSFILISFI
jgi:hypothetical protein